jgi:hypothetical protein
MFFSLASSRLSLRFSLSSRQSCGDFPQRRGISLRFASFSSPPPLRASSLPDTLAMRDNMPILLTQRYTRGRVRR